MLNLNYFNWRLINVYEFVEYRVQNNEDNTGSYIWISPPIALAEFLWNDTIASV